MKQTQAYAELLKHYNELKAKTLTDLFANDKNRATKFGLQLDGLQYDFSKNNITEETLTKLIALAKEQNLEQQIKAMFSGERINNTENRAVLHTALRADEHAKIYIDKEDVMPEVRNVLKRMQTFSQKLHAGIHLGYTGHAITDIVNIGIGGSDLGPVLVCQALKPYRQNNLNIHFISSVDGYMALDVLSNLNPETTLFIIASKTFTTQETMTNAATARKWFIEKTGGKGEIHKHFVAVSTNKTEVTKFGIDENNMFGFWDFVGGRYSLWSAIGLSIILYIGFDNFNQLLSGARAMDEHFQTADLRHNLPVIMALIGIWYTNFYEYKALSISPYNTRLTRFPAYVQQLEMESNGKSVDKDGKPLDYNTCPIIWGDSGINGQHAYYQLLHQGTSITPMDIIVALSDKFSLAEHQDILVANAYAQAEAFMLGKTYDQAKSELLANHSNEYDASFLAKHKVFPGDRPSNMLLLSEISPYILGKLIVLYEHKTFTQGIIWGVNSFDQMGVELGKQLTKNILADIKGQKVGDHDSSTNNLIQLYLNKKK